MPPSNPLQQLHHLKPSSPRFSAQIASILDGAEYKVGIQTLQDEELAWLLGYLDNVLDTFDSTSPVFRTCQRELRRICGIRQTLPRSYALSGSLLDTHGRPIARGYFGDVHMCSRNGSKVRVKRLSTSSNGGQKLTKDFYEEAVVWKRLGHPNIVPLLCITITPPQLVSDWIPGGNLTEYIKNHPGADQLGLLSGIANGLEYLHSNDVVHGNLKGPNVLVDSGRARITDFGLVTIPQNPASKRATVADQTARWTAPEILHDNGTYSKAADVFSFAMVVIEVYTGAVPFDNSPPIPATVAIMQGNRPPRPTHQAFSDELWTLTQRCWDQKPCLRPEVAEVFQALSSCAFNKLRRLSKLGIASHEFELALAQFYESTGYQDRVDSLHGAGLKNFVDFLDTVLRTKGLNPSLVQQTLHNLRGVCGRRAIIPSSHIISSGLCKPGNRPLEANRYPEVWVGKFSRAQGSTDQKDVHVKVVKFEKSQKELYGVVATWAWLDHPNILRCFGITVDPLQVVTEWVPNGDVLEYVRTNANADRVCLLMDVVQGLNCLHSHRVVHGGLMPQSVLVNAAGRACLSDIGFTTFAHINEPGADDTESSVHGSRWTPPEVFKNSKFSKQSDVFSFGFVAAEVLAGELLWSGVSATEVRSKIADGERPRMPEGMAEFGITAEMWGMLNRCWEIEAEERITISGVLSFLESTPQPISGTLYIFKKMSADAQIQPSQDFIDELDEEWLYDS